MATEVILPQIGFSMADGELLEWSIPDGGHAEEGKMLYLLEAEKVNVEIESPATGTLRIMKQPGLYDVGTVLGVID